MSDNEINQALIREAIEKFSLLSDQVSALTEAREEESKRPDDSGSSAADVSKAIQDAFESISRSFGTTLKAEISGIGSDIAGALARTAKEPIYKPFNRIGDQLGAELDRTFSAKESTKEQVRQIMSTGRGITKDEIRAIQAENSRLVDYQREADRLVNETLNDEAVEFGRRGGGFLSNASRGLGEGLDFLAAPIINFNPFGVRSVVDRVRNYWNETTGE